MKNWIINTVCCLLTISCLSAQERLHIDPERTLTVYLSRTQNTKVIAEIIQEEVGGKLVAIELENPYPEDYQKTVNQVAEENRSGYLPPLKTKIENIRDYDVVFVGFPTWGMELPPPIKSFFTHHNLSNLTIIPFNTHAGYGFGNSFETLKKLCPQSKVLKGFSTQGGKEKDGILNEMNGNIMVKKAVIDWLNNLKY
jgi:flavodoxin